MKKRVYVILFLAIAFASFAIAQTDVPSTVTVNLGSSNDFLIIYDEYRNGVDTTDFDSMTDEELGQLTSLVLNNVSYGRVSFLTGLGNEINITEVHLNKIVDIDQYLEFDQNSFFIDTTYFTNLVRPITVSLFNVVGVSDPRVLRNGVACSDCNIISFDGSTLVFDTSSLTDTESSTFVVENAGCTSNCGGGGGGGGNSRDRDRSPSVNFTVSPEVIRLQMKPGETRFVDVMVESSGRSGIFIYQEALIFKDWVRFFPYNFSIGPDEPTEKVTIEFNIPSEQHLGLFTDKLFFKYNDTYFKEVRVIYEIVDDQVLFDLTSGLSDNLLWNYQRIKPEITMINLGNLRNVDVTLEYFVKDYENEEIKIGEQAFVISEREITVKPEIPLYKYIRDGDYVFYTTLNYEGNQALASNEFSVNYFNIWLYLLILLIILGIVSVFLWLYDDDYRRFRKIIVLGEHYLDNKDLDNAKRKYGKMQRKFPYMNSWQRKFARKDSMSFYEKLVKFAKGKK